MQCSAVSIWEQATTTSLFPISAPWAPSVLCLDPPVDIAARSDTEAGFDSIGGQS